MTATRDELTDAGFAATMAAYEAETPGSRRALARAAALLPTGLSRQTLTYPPYPFFATRGSGAQVFDVDGRAYLDFVNNYTSLIHGHGHERTVRAVQTAVADACAPGAPTERELRLAQELSTRIPSLELLRFAISGSEAVGFALRAARAFTGRRRIVKFEGGFHGCFDDVQHSIGAPPMEAGAFGAGAPAGDGVAGRDTLVCVYNDLASVESAFATHGEEIAAVIVEPYLGNGALIRAADGFLAAVRGIAHAHGALLLLDEIQSCRVAYGGAQSLHDVQPDLTLLGKTIGGGLPLAAFGGRRDVMEQFDGQRPRIVQTGTFNAFPPSLAAGLATLADWGSAEIATLNTRAERTRVRVRELLAARGVAGTVNGEGSMLHVELVEGPVERYRDIATDRTSWQRLHLELLVRGVYLTGRGSGCLSTAMTDADLDRFAEAFDGALAAVAR